MSAPLISVLLPVRNGERFLLEAIQSLQSQTFTDFECLCLDDGSTDGSRELLEGIAREDRRFQSISQSPQGITATLNRGIELARGSYLARMDADDLSLPTRFSQQIDFLEQHPEVVAVGGQFELMDEEGRSLGPVKVPLAHSEIDAAHLQGRGGMAHPAVMVRTNVMKQVGGYREQFPVAQDKDLWLRLAEQGQLANLPACLLRYRLHPQSVSFEKSTGQIQAVQRAVHDACERRKCAVPSSLEENLKQYQREQQQPFEWKLSRAALANGERATAWRYACRYWKSTPAKPHAWLWLLRNLIPPVAASHKQTASSDSVPHAG